MRISILTLVSVATLAASCGRLQGLAGNKKITQSETNVLVLGDSLSTGLFTSENFWLNYGGIVAAAVKGEKPKALGPDGATRSDPISLRKPKEEISMFGAAGPEAANALLHVIEWPNLSWESKLASDKDVAGDHVVIAARNGAQSPKAVDEVDTWVGDVKDKKKPQLPNDVFIFFTGDDLCRGEGEQDTFTPAAQYSSAIKDSVLRLATTADPNPAGTNVYLISHLNVMQLATNPDLLKGKTIHVTDAVGDRHTSCLEFIQEYQQKKRASPASSDLVSFTYNPMHICYNVLAHAPGMDPAQAKVPLATLQSTMTAYRQGLVQIAGELPKDPAVKAAGMRIKLIKGTEDLVETPTDIANDCFHLSGSGQERLAQVIEAELDTH